MRVASIDGPNVGNRGRPCHQLLRRPGVGTIRVCAVLFLLGASSANVLRAGVITVIDDFTVADVPSPWPHIEGFGSPPAVPHTTTINEDGLDTSHAIGGTRDTEITVDAAVGGGVVFANVNTTDQWFNFSLSSGYSGFAELTYDGDGSGLNFDAAANPSIDRVSIEFVAIDLTTSVTVTINGVSAAPQAIGGGAGTIEFFLTEFAGVDFSDVDDIVVQFDDDTDAVDLRVRIIGFAGPMVPEPTTGLLAFAALPIAIATRRRGPHRRVAAFGSRSE